MLTRPLDGAEVLMIGARFGVKVRVDSSLQGRNDHQSEFLTEKAASLADVFAKEPPLLSGSPQQPQRRLGELSMEPDNAPDSIHGSVELSEKEFEQWNEEGGFARPLQEPAGRIPARRE